MKRRKTKLKVGTRDLARKDVTVAPCPWDMGARPAARESLAVIEGRGELDTATGTVINPNDVKGLRYRDMLEIWHRKGAISTAGYNAGEKLRNAWEGTQRGPGWPDNDRVQSSPKPDHAVEIQIDRISALQAITKRIPEGDRDILTACVMEEGTPARIRGYRGPGYQIGMKHLRDALDRLAVAIGC
jgi:hypothetical protein